MVSGGTLAVLIGAGIIVVGLLVYTITIYNGLVSLRNQYKKAWANIDVLLKQRNDELPNLITTVKGYMKHEKQVLEQVTKARAAVMGAGTLGKKAAADNLLSETLKSLFAVAENYPDLKANKNFLKLQERITGLENEIADRREFYNDAVTRYNIRIQSFPDVFFARMFSFTEQALFKASARDKKVVSARF